MAKEKTTVGKVILKKYVPPNYHSLVSGELDKKGILNLFNKLAELPQDTYKKTVSELTRLGFEIATRTGTTLRLEDLLSPVDRDALFKELESQITRLKQTEKDPVKLNKKLSEIYQNFSQKVDKLLLEEGLKRNQTLAKIVKSGSRGNIVQLRQTIFSPITVPDQHGRPITEFSIKNSFADGLSVPEYLVSTFGARTGEAAKTFAISKAGYLGKQLSRAAMPLIVEEHDCGTDRGIPVSTGDKDSIGSYLAAPVGRFKKNNEVTAQMLNELALKKIPQIIVRSPITCQSSAKFHHGAVCQLCVGKHHHYPNNEPIGSYIGVTAATSLAEPMSQAQLSLKHVSGALSGIGAGATFQDINNILNIPKHFPNEAIIAEEDGKVTDVVAAPQGGYYIKVNNKKEYYVPPGINVKVKKGSSIIAGDVLTEGIVNPAKIVKYKGIGEGRRVLALELKNTMENFGISGINRRNYEILSRAIIDHVKITGNEGTAGYMPDDIVSYQDLEAVYTPRKNSKWMSPEQALNKYLEKPVLHYTIGDRITSDVINTLKQNKIRQILVNDNKPDFEPEMQRLLDIPMYEQDWMHQLYSTNLERRLINAVNTGAVSDLRGPSPIAGIAYGVDFGKLPRPVRLVRKKKASDEYEELEDDDDVSFSFETGESD